MTSDQPRRYLALWFPFLAAERQRSLCGVLDEPLVLTARAGNMVRLVAVSRVAAAMGLVPELTLADARARMPDLIAIESDRDADARLMRRLALWCDRFTPLVALDREDGLLLDITGCAGLFGGETALRRGAVMRLKRFGFSARSCIAGTPEAAGALTRFGRGGIITEGGESKAVAGLPVAALMASDETTRALSRAGLKTIGDLAVRPSAALTARFGPGLVTRLHRICGREAGPVTPLRPLPQCRADRRFAEPLMSESVLMSVLADLLGEVFTELERRGEGGRIFEVSFFRTDGDIRRLGVETGQASRDVSVLLKLFAERIAALADPIDPGFGFDAMRLSVLQTEKLQTSQPAFDRRGAEAAAFVILIDRLTARFGLERVQSFVPRDTHMPELETRVVPAQKIKANAPWRPPERDEPPLRPLQLFHPPQPVSVIAGVPDGPPKRFMWRRVVHDVVAFEGPERIAPEWWQDGHQMLTRDYYRAEDREGRRFWLYRHGLYGRETSEPEWYLHGLFA